MKEFAQILQEKRAYYGHTEAAIEFAAEEYADQFKPKKDMKKPPCPICDANTTIIHEKTFCTNENCHHFYNPIEQNNKK